LSWKTVVAYSGLRWGEQAGLTLDQVDVDGRRLRVDRQVIETRSALKETLPKGRRRRTTMFPARTPGGVDLDRMVRRRIAEIDSGDGLLFPAATRRVGASVELRAEHVGSLRRSRPILSSPSTKSTPVHRSASTSERRQLVAASTRRHSANSAS
jgi:integrase